jgi:hypothetical protein
MFLRYLLLYLLSILILIFTVAVLTSVITLLTRLPTLQDFLMLFIHLLHLFLLVLPSHFLAATFDILDISRHFSIFSHLSQLAAMLLFCLELALLIFIQPRDGFNIDVELLERIYAFSEDFFHSWDPEKEEGVGDHTDIHILELKDILQVMLFICSYIRNECPFSFLDVVPVTCDYLIQLFFQTYWTDFFVDKFILVNLGDSYTLVSEISNKRLLMSFYQ